MTIHYHGTPITPNHVLATLAGKHFCVSHANPQNVARCHKIGQSVMLDNGAFSKWRSGKQTDWSAYYTWCDVWLAHKTSWAIPPDVIDGSIEEQDHLLAQWPHGKKQASPVWHINEPIGRLCDLIEQGWNRVCVGSTAQYSSVMSRKWAARMDEIWDCLLLYFGAPPDLHMLRGMRCSGQRWPFISVDSTDVARNHHLPGKTARAMADRWDAVQCAHTWFYSDEEL